MPINVGSLFLCMHILDPGTKYYDIACVHVLCTFIHDIVGTLILQCYVLSYSFKEKRFTVVIKLILITMLVVYFFSSTDSYSDR